MPTITTGMIATNDVLSNEQVVDMSEQVYKLQPDATQFTTMLMELSKKQATQYVIDWLEEEYRPRTTSMTASATSAATAFGVTAGHGNTVVAVGDVVRVMETGEALLVTTAAASAFTATRSWGGTAAASATSAAKLMIVGNAAAQGASSGTARYVVRARGYNYIQEIRHPIFFSTVHMASELYGGRDPGKELVREAINHKRNVESTLFWGARDYSTSTSPGPTGGCGGAFEFISTNVTNTSGATTPAEVDTFLRTPLSYAEDPVLFCSPLVASILSQMYRGIWQPNQGGLQKYGVKVTAFLDSTYGTNVPVITKKEWIDLNATGTNYGTYAFLIDMAAVRLRPLRGFNVGSLRRNIQEPSATAEVHEYYSPLSLEFAHESRHGILKGATSYAAS